MDIKTANPRYGSLFTGIGGFDLALDRAGFECAFQCEIDKNCQKLLQSKWDVELIGDVKDVKRGKAVDIIVGGFPCQDLSINGKGAGLAGKRSGLWFEFARVIDELEPRWVIIENVPGLLSSNRGGDFAVIISWLAERGYGVAWRVLDAQYFGVPQRRRRVFIVGSLGNGRAAEVLFERERCEKDFGKNKEKKCQNTWKTKIGVGHSGGKTIKLNKFSNTISCQIGSKTTAMFNGIYDNERIRIYTPTECERLQGFPDGWTEGFADSTRYRMLGNAVAVPVVEWIAKRILSNGHQDG